MLSKLFLTIKNINLALVLLILFGVFYAGYSFVYAWTGPTQTAPAGNTPAPINVGAATQSKSGILSLGGLQIPNGATAGLVLTSDTAGNATWQTPPSGLTAGTITTRTATVNAFRWPAATAQCLSNEVLLSGGGVCSSSIGWMWIYASIPSGNGWYLACDTSQFIQATAVSYARCMTI